MNELAIRVQCKFCWLALLLVCVTSQKTKTIFSFGNFEKKTKLGWAGMYDRPALLTHAMNVCTLEYQRCCCCSRRSIECLLQ